jgi:predicted phosphodiesterase
MRIALISDIHGNAIALDAVLEDATSHDVDAYWFLGDHVAIGPEPGAVLDRLARLDHALFIRGNTDRYVVTGETPPPGLSTAQADPALVPLHAAIAASFAWTRGFVTAEGKLRWLADLPLELRFTCGDGIRVLAVHASPGNDDGEGIHPGMSNDEIQRLVSDTTADLIFVGHTHEAMVRRVGSRIVINSGSVSNPKASDLRASYVILNSSSAGTSFTHRSVDYDREAFADTVRQSHHPAAHYILSFQRGEVAGKPPHHDHTTVVYGETIHVALDAC